MGVKYDLPNLYVSEMTEYQVLYALGATRTVSGSGSWVSTSSGLTYNYTTGQQDLFLQLQTALDIYLITAIDYNDKIYHSLSTAGNDFLVGSGANTFIKKTLSEAKTILGINTTDSPTFAGLLCSKSINGSVTMNVVNTNATAGQNRYATSTWSGNNGGIQTTMVSGRLSDNSDLAYCGTTTNHDFSIITNNTIRLTVSNAGVITLGSLAGVLKGTAGVISGGATLDDVAEGTTYKRLTATKDGYLTQSVTTTATPQFARLGLGAVADGTAALKVTGTSIFTDSLTFTKGATFVVGTSDAFALHLYTNGSAKVTIASNGNTQVVTSVDGTLQMQVRNSNTTAGQARYGQLYVCGDSTGVLINIKAGKDTSNNGYAWIGTDTAHNLSITTNSTVMMTINGLSTTPIFGFGTSDLEAWDTSNTVLHVGGNGAIMSTTAVGATAYVHWMNNAYNDGAWKFRSTDEATMYSQFSGTHVFYVTASGSADAAITWLPALEITTAKNILCNGATADATAVGVFSIKNGTAPAAHVDDVIQIYAADTAGAGTSSLALYAEVAVAADADESKFSNKLAVMINGTLYYIMLTVS